MWMAPFDWAAFIIVAASDGDAMRAPAAMAAALIDEPSGFGRESIRLSVFVCDGVVGCCADD
jgi:hypothetical protein